MYPNLPEEWCQQSFLSLLRERDGTARRRWNQGTRQESRFRKDIILQVSGVSQAAIAAIPGPSIDDRQSIDSLLADNDGQDMKQEETRTQHPEQNVAQVFEVDGALPPPAVDLLHAAVDELMVDSDMQNQEQDSLEP